MRLNCACGAYIDLTCLRNCHWIGLLNVIKFKIVDQKTKPKNNETKRKEMIFFACLLFFPLSLYLAHFKPQTNTHILRKNFNVIVCASSKIPTVICCFSFSISFPLLLYVTVVDFFFRWTVARLLFQKRRKQKLDKKQRKRGKSKQHTIQNFYSTWMCVCAMLSWADIRDVGWFVILSRQRYFVSNAWYFRADRAWTREGNESTDRTERDVYNTKKTQEEEEEEG